MFKAVSGLLSPFGGREDGPARGDAGYDADEALLPANDGREAGVSGDDASRVNNGALLPMTGLLTGCPSSVPVPRSEPLVLPLHGV